MSTKQMVMEEQDKIVMQGQNKINLKVVAFQIAIEIFKTNQSTDFFILYDKVYKELNV